MSNSKIGSKNVLVAGIGPIQLTGDNTAIDCAKYLRLIAVLLVSIPFKSACVMFPNIPKSYGLV